MKTAPSALQREGTRHQLPPLSLRCESRSNNVHNDRSSDDFKRGTISVTHGADSQTQARPSTGYGRRLRAASDGDELVGSESKAAQVDGKSSVLHNPSKGKSCKSEQRPRSSYGSRMQPSRDQSQETVDGDSVCSSRGATNAKCDDVHTKHMLSMHGKATSSNNKHRPLRVCRSHELEHDFSCNQEQEQNMSYAMSNTTFVRPKSGRGRSRKPPSPRLNRPESDFTTGGDLVRPGAPTPPSDMLEDKEDFTGDSFVARNRTSRLMTLWLTSLSFYFISLWCSVCPLPKLICKKVQLLPSLKKIYFQSFPRFSRPNLKWKKKNRFTCILSRMQYAYGHNFAKGIDLSCLSISFPVSKFYKRVKRVRRIWKLTVIVGELIAFFIEITALILLKILQITKSHLPGVKRGKEAGS